MLKEMTSSPFRKMRCDFCGADIPQDSAICPKCKKKQVETIVAEIRATGAYNEEDEVRPPKRSFKVALRKYLLLIGITMAISLPIGFMGGWYVLILIGIVLCFVTAFVGGGYIPPTTAPLARINERRINPIWASVGIIALIFLVMGALFLRLS